MRTVLILFLSFFLTHCATGKEFVLPAYKNQFYEGWGGPPMEEEKQPFDYIYTKVAGKATRKAIQSGSGGMMHNSCTASILETAGTKLSTRILSEYQKEHSSKEPEKLLQKINTLYERDYKEPKLKECRPTAKADKKILYSEFKTCECIVYIRIVGGKKEVSKSLENL